MILKFFPQPDSPHSQIFRKAGQKKAEPNRTKTTDQTEWLAGVAPACLMEMLWRQLLPSSSGNIQKKQSNLITTLHFL
jgi:hypothetical protein